MRGAITTNGLVGPKDAGALTVWERVVKKRESNVHRLLSSDWDDRFCVRSLGYISYKNVADGVIDKKGISTCM